LFSHGGAAAILVSKNNETAAVLVYQTSPVGKFGFINWVGNVN